MPCTPGPCRDRRRAEWRQSPRPRSSGRRSSCHSLRGLRVPSERIAAALPPSPQDPLGAPTLRRCSCRPLDRRVLPYSSPGMLRNASTGRYASRACFPWRLDRLLIARGAATTLITFVPSGTRSPDRGRVRTMCPSGTFPERRTIRRPGRSPASRRMTTESASDMSRTSGTITVRAALSGMVDGSSGSAAATISGPAAGSVGRFALVRRSLSVMAGLHEDS